MTISLEDRTTTVEIGGRTLAAEVRKYDGQTIVAWVPELQRTLTLENTRDASTSGKYYSADDDATLYYTYKTYKQGTQFVKITKDKRTKTV